MKFRAGTIAARVARQIAEDMKKRLGGDLLAGEAVAAHRRESRGDVSPTLLKRARHLSERALRTEAAIAYNHEYTSRTRARAKDVPQLRRMWLVDGNPCRTCASMDEVTVAVDEPFVLPGGDAISGPPVHPHCMCTTVPWRVEWEASPYDGTGEEIKRRARLAKQLEPKLKNQTFDQRDEHAPRPEMKPPTLKQSGAKRTTDEHGRRAYWVNVSSLDDIHAGIWQAERARSVMKAYLAGDDKKLPPIIIARPSKKLRTTTRSLVDGNHRLAVARALGIKRIKVRF